MHTIQPGDTICPVCDTGYRTKIAYQIWCERFHRLRANDEELMRARMLIVHLTPKQLREAMNWGKKVHSRAREFNRVGKNNQPLSQQARDNKIGGLGERGILVHLGLPFSEMDYYPADLRAKTGGGKPADVRGFIDVRTHLKEPGYSHLLIQEDDPGDRVYVSAAGLIDDPVVFFYGWIYGAQGKQAKYWDLIHRPDRPCYCVPDSKLLRFRPMSTLPKSLEEARAYASK